MPRNLVICCDGTSNKFGSANTNVVRLVQVLDRDSSKQRLYYDPGVGTLPEPGALTAISKKLTELKGLAFGAGLSRNVEEAYSFLMEMWEPGDQVFLFGFSRGAYTVRVLAGLLHSLGLLPRGGGNLVPYVMRLFKAVRRKPGNENSEYWKLCNQFRWSFARKLSDGDDNRRFRVHFLGVWDTVSSVGWVWNPASYPYTAENPSVDVVRHAVSIDERRWFFRQNLMRQAKGQDFRELWFSGVHCDIGGGYTEDRGQLWRVAFEWMLGEAIRSGLRVDASRKPRVLAQLPPDVHLWAAQTNESLTPLWYPAEFFPKLVWKPGRSRRWPGIGFFGSRFIKEGDYIHQSTLQRLRGVEGYKPRNMSAEFIAKVRALPPNQIPQWMPYESVVSQPMSSSRGA
jgi:uncharacterized protein (DUF2235 family)